MSTDDSGAGESQRHSGGLIPGTRGLHAYTVSGPVPSSIPVLLAVPHAGRTYTGSLLEHLRHPDSAALRLEDRYVDHLARDVAKATGAALLVAHAPRAMIDLNRAPDDVDWEMFGRGARRDGASYMPGRRSRSGLGLIPRRLPGIGELWKRRHEEGELEARISGVHEPYHDAAAAVLERLHRRWGAALLIDLHSMPPLAPRNGLASPEFVLGDRFGAACHGGLAAAAFSYFGELERIVAHNRPYAGGYVLERHASPGRGVHALQIEIDRSLYLDDDLSEPGEGFTAMVQILAGLVRRLAVETATLGQDDGSVRQEAAE